MTIKTKQGVRWTTPWYQRFLFPDRPKQSVPFAMNTRQVLRDALTSFAHRETDLPEIVDMLQRPPSEALDWVAETGEQLYGKRVEWVCCEEGSIGVRYHDLPDGD